MDSINFGYRVWLLFLFTLNLKTQTIKICEGVIIGRLIQFSTTRTIKTSDKNFEWFRLQLFWWRHGISLPIYTIMSKFFMSTLSTTDSCPLVCCRSVKWLIFCGFRTNKNGSNCFTIIASEGTWVHFCTWLELNCLRMFCSPVTTKGLGKNPW